MLLKKSLLVCFTLWGAATALRFNLPTNSGSGVVAPCGLGRFHMNSNDFRRKKCSSLIHGKSYDIEGLLTDFQGVHRLSPRSYHVLHSMEKSVDGEKESNKSDDGKEVVQAKITVSGQVQGGFYRAMAKKEASFHRRLVGGIRDLRCGSVEIVVEGPRKKLESFIGWCKRGPGLTQAISQVEVEWSPSTGIFDSFETFPDQDPCGE